MFKFVNFSSQEIKGDLVTKIARHLAHSGTFISHSSYKSMIT